VDGQEISSEFLGVPELSFHTTIRRSWLVGLQKQATKSWSPSVIFERRSLVVWSRRTDERRVWHRFWMLDIEREDSMVRSKELRQCRSVVVGGWDAVWAHVVCSRSGDAGGLNAVKWACLNWRADVVGFVMRGCRRCKQLLCCFCDLQSVNLSGWARPQLRLFGGVQMGILHSPVACGWSHLTHLWE